MKVSGLLNGNHDNIEFRSAWDDAVAGLSRTQCDVGSALTDKDIAEWQRHLPFSLSPGDACYPNKPLTDFMEKKNTEQNEKKTKCTVLNLQVAGGAVTGSESRSDGDFLRVCTFIIQSDIHNIRYGGQHFCLIFMRDIKKKRHQCHSVRLVTVTITHLLTNIWNLECKSCPYELYSGLNSHVKRNA